MPIIDNAQAKYFYGLSMEKDKHIAELEEEVKNLKNTVSTLRTKLYYHRFLVTRTRKLLTYIKKRTTLLEIPKVKEMIWWIKDTLKEIKKNDID
jgi:hypothetical protein